MSSSFIPLNLFLTTNFFLQTNQEISSVEDSLHQLREALRSKDGPMKVATTRFAVRAKRPNVEQTRDYVHGGLLSEINDISGSQEALKVRFKAFLESWSCHGNIFYLCSFF